jgi:hypothetical protein
MRSISTGAFVQERDSWGDAVDRARVEAWPGIELCAILPTLVETLGLYLAQAEDPLAAFARVSLHAPVGIDAAEPPIDAIRALPLDGDVVLHPDLYGTGEAANALGGRAVFENMDVAKSFGRTVDDLASVFARYPRAGFCLDVAHVWTNDRSLALGHALLDAFGDRLRQVHLSGIEPDGMHRETTEDDLALYAPLLARCPDAPQVLETVLA